MEAFHNNFLNAVIFNSISTFSRELLKTITIYAYALIQGAVKGVNNYLDDRKSGRIPRLKLEVDGWEMQRVSLFFAWG